MKKRRGATCRVQQDQNRLDQAQRKTQDRIPYAATRPLTEVMTWAGSNLGGLTQEEVLASRTKNGRNVIACGKKKSLARRLADAFVNPFTAILFFLAVISAVTDMLFPALSIMGNTPEDFDPLTVVIITTMVILSGTLRYIQEARSGNAAEKLLDMITTTATVSRKGAPREEIPIDEVVVGDIVHLSAGDMIPADMRIIEAKDLFVSQASLTGESEPVEKIPASCEASDSATSYENIALMGSSVVSGSATALAFSVGDGTLFGAMTSNLSDEAVETSFSKGVNSVSQVLIKFMMVMVPFVFVINGITKGDWLEAGLFAISIAVGLTPEMLPMIVTTCLAKGAVAMSKKQTIVKNLNSIQNFGAMDVLCTDKTGTLTQDQVVLEYHWNIDGQEDSRVLRHAYLNSYFQTGYKNLMDLAIIKCTEEEELCDPRLTDLSEAYVKIDEVPFDFTRRRLSTVVRDRSGKIQMVTKGAVEEMLSICSFAEVDGEVCTLDNELRNRILTTVSELNGDGFRVLAIAQKSNPSPVGAFSAADECDMVLMGYLAFLDPPKESTADAIEALRQHGVATKILTGDNEKVTRTICKQVGLEVNNMLLGQDIAAMDDEQLARKAEHTQVFAKLTPDQKTRIVSILRENGHVVGYMGDGIGHEVLRYRYLRRYRRRCCQGICRYHPVGKRPYGPGRGHCRGPQDLRKHDQVHQDDRQLELWQHVQRPRRLCPAAVFAYDEHPAYPAQPYLRLQLPGDSLGQRRRGVPARAAQMGRLKHWEVHALDWAYQLHLRFYDLHLYVLCLLPAVCKPRRVVQQLGKRLLGRHPRRHADRLHRPVPGRLVC